MTLAAATKGLYAAFARYPRREVMEACPHCVGREEQDCLVRVPLRSLSCEQLSRFAFKAMTTWGEPEDYKHFLPRILELALTPEARSWPGLAVELVADKVRQAGCGSWPAVERAALQDYLRAVWNDVLAHEPGGGTWRADEALPFIACVAEDVGPFLDAWAHDESLPSALQLAALLDSVWADLANFGYLRGPWRKAASRHVVESWLVAPARRSTLEAAFERYLDDPRADRLAAAVDAWQWMTSGIR